uniref:peptidylprolyl isomerase n=1 Tax=Nothobranchius furzeri TaxID=105023 RepID=A0A8C6W0F3_NOTFU
MGIKIRPRCFFDIGISNVLVGRVVVELFSDICPKTCENFRCLCTGEKGLGKGTQKPLHYKGCLFHRIVKDFMIQGGDFSEGNGRGGESIYGGFFEDESFTIKHNKEYLLSMANRGKDTNGSQFFITTKPSPHLDGVHVVFGHVISGQEVVQTMENQKTDPNSKPYADVKILNCGELIPKSKAKKERKKEKAGSSSSGNSSDSQSSSESSSDSEESGAESKKEKKKVQHVYRSDAENAEEKEQEDLVTSTVRPEEIPPVPENRFLMRRSPQAVQRSDENDQRKREDRPRHNMGYNSQSAYQRRFVVTTRSGRKIKGRGPRLCHRNRFRRSETPPHWRQEMQRQRMRAVTGERWIKGDKSELSEQKNEETKAPKQERRTSSTQDEHAAESKKDKKTRSRRSKSKENDAVEKEKHSKHKAKKKEKSRSRSRDKKRSKSREKAHKNKSEHKRGRSRSKEKTVHKKEDESEPDQSKDKSKDHESHKTHKEGPKGEPGERTVQVIRQPSKSLSKERSATKDESRSRSRNKDRRGPEGSKDKEEKREKDKERGRERSSKERPHNSERENRRRGGSKDKDRRSKSPDRSKTRDSHRGRRSRSRSHRRDRSRERSSHRKDRSRERANQRRRRSSSSSDSDKAAKRRRERSPDSTKRGSYSSRSKDKRSPARPDSTKGRGRKDGKKKHSSSSSDSD